MSELRAVIFDVDGTLAETERNGHLVAVNDAFKMVGLDWFWTESMYDELLKVTGSVERIGHYVETYHPEYRSVNENLDQLIEEIVRQKHINYKGIAERGEIPLRLGVERVLRELQASEIRMAIATTSSLENVEALLVGDLDRNALNWFEVIAAGNVVPHKKPAPDVYTWTLDKMNLSPSECLAVEDSENGVRSAQAAGIPVLAIKSELSGDHDLSGSALLVNEWGTPDLPMQVLAGSAASHSMVSLALMKEVMRSI